MFAHNSIAADGASSSSQHESQSHNPHAHNLVSSQISDSLDEGLDNPSRRASLTSSGFPNQGSQVYYTIALPTLNNSTYQ